MVPAYGGGGVGQDAHAIAKLHTGLIINNSRGRSHWCAIIYKSCIEHYPVTLMNNTSL